MKIIMGITQAVIGLIIFGIITLFMIINIGAAIINEAIDYFRKINNEVKEDIKEYYKNIEKNERN